MLFTVAGQSTHVPRSRAALAIALLLGSGCGGQVAETVAPSITPEQEHEELQREIAERRTKIEAEIARLGSGHAWAGQYYEGDGLGSNTTVWVAPESGCLAVSGGCLGIYAANWGRVEAHGARITLHFDRVPGGRVSTEFDSEYTVWKAGDGRVLNPSSSRAPLSLLR